MSTSRTLVLLRHGQSTANADDILAGWLDVDLTDRGRQEARRAAELIERAGIRPHVVHTSLLTRATATAEIVAATWDRPGLVIRRTWRLNERHYGALQGRPRAAVRAEIGDDRYQQIRRSYQQHPPPAVADNPVVPRYRHLPAGVPDGESLADVRARLLPYWQDFLAADVAAGSCPLIVAHGNSLRALCMILDHLSSDAVSTLTIPTGIPLRYDLDATWTPTRPGGTYLDADAAAAGIAEVAAPGQPQHPER